MESYRLYRERIIDFFKAVFQRMIDIIRLAPDTEAVEE